MPEGDMKEGESIRPDQFKSELDFKPSWESKLPGQTPPHEMPVVLAQLGAESDPGLEAFLAQRGRNVEQYEQGRGVESLFAKTNNPAALVEVARQYQLVNEEGDTYAELASKWDITRPVGALRDRQVCLSTSFKRLILLGMAEKLDKESTDLLVEKLNKGNRKGWTKKNVKAVFGLPVSGGFGLETVGVTKKTIDSYTLDEEEEMINVRYRPSEESITHYGTDKERKKLVEELKRTRQEIEIRNLIHENWGFYHQYREALATLSEMYFHPVPSSEAIHILYNLPFNKGETAKSVTGSEFRSFGDKIEMAKRLYYINSISEKPTLIKDLMTRPGWKLVFPDGTKKDEFVEEWIGEPSKWLDEHLDERGNKIPWVDPGGIGGLESNPLGTIRTKNQIKIENGFRPHFKNKEGGRELSPSEYKRFNDDNKWNNKRDGEIVWRLEEENDFRGKLTRNNIFAKSGHNDAKLHEAIQEFLRGGEGASEVDQLAAETAQSLAYRDFKLDMSADNYGIEFYREKGAPDELGIFKDKALQFENGPASSDFSKTCYPSGYDLKNKRRARKAPISRDFGPEGSFGKVPRLTTDFLRMVATPTGKGEMLSFHEQWWGYYGNGKDKEDPDYLGEVKAKRIGELPWIGLEMEKITEEDVKLLGFPANEREAEEMGVPLTGISGEARVAQYLTVFMAGWDKSEGRTYAMMHKTDFGGSLRDLENFQLWLKFNKALDVGVKDGVAVNGIFRGKTPAEVAELRKSHIQHVINVFWDGVRSTPEYQMAYEKEEVFPGWFGDRAVPRYRYIMAIAKKAGVKLVDTQPTHELKT